MEAAQVLKYKRDVMATVDQVKALIRSHADGDNTRFYAIAMQVAAQAARSGHGSSPRSCASLSTK